MPLTAKIKKFLAEIRDDSCGLRKECKFKKCNECDYSTLFLLRSTEGFKLAIVDPKSVYQVADCKIKDEVNKTGCPILPRPISCWDCKNCIPKTYFMEAK